MPPRPSRGPTSLHLASLGSPFALLTGFSCPPPPRFASLPSCALPHAFSHPTTSLVPSSLSPHANARARARDRESPAPRSPSRSHAPSFLFLLSTAVSSPSLSAAPFARLDLTLLFPSRTLVLLLLPVPPRPPPPSILIDRSCTRHRAPLRIISSRLPRLALALLFPPFSALSSSSSLFLSACSPSAASSSFVPYSILSPPGSPTPSRFPAPCSCARRGINYSKNLYCYYYRLTIPSALEPETRIRVQYNARLCSRPADYVNPTTARATTATTDCRCLVPLW